jgi:hypothetical protein
MKSFCENKLEKEEVVYELVKIGFEAKILELSGKFSNNKEENEEVINEIKNLVSVVEYQKEQVEFVKRCIQETGEKENG